MKKFRVIALLLVLVMSVGLVVGCADKDKEPAKTGATDKADPGGDKPSGKVKKYSVGVGNTGGMFYVMGSGWVNIMNAELSGRYQFTAEQTGGAPANVSLLENGDIQFGHGGTSAMADAYHGTAPWSEGIKFTKIRAIFPMFTMSLTPFTLKENNITTLKDLDGKKVGLGSKGSGVDSTVRKIFEELGIKPSSIYNDTWAATVTALQDGTIDAVVTQQVAPWPSLTELEASKEVVLIEMTDDELEVIKGLFPFYSDAVIPKGAYKANADKDIKSLCEWSFMQASADVPDEDVYEILEATFATYDDLLLVHPGLAGVVPENAAKIPVTWHPGAIKFYTDKGITLAEVHPLFAPEK